MLIILKLSFWIRSAGVVGAAGAAGHWGVSLHFSGKTVDLI